MIFMDRFRPHKLLEVFEADAPALAGPEGAELAGLNESHCGNPTYPESLVDLPEGQYPCL